MHHSPAPSKLYLWLLLGPIVAVVVALVAVGLWVGPATGDLTRIGKYSDRDFGFNGKEVWLVNPNPPISRAPFGVRNNWQRQGDILVFGDSFSDRRAGKLTWLDLVQHRFDLPMHIVLPSDFAEVSQYLESPQFKANPPKAIVVQTVERAFRTRALGLYADSAVEAEGCLPFDQQPLPKVLLDTRKPLATVQKNRQENFENIHALFERSTNVVRKSFRPKKNRVVVAHLSNTSLFSNAKSDHILLYDEDLSKHRVRGLTESELSLENQKMRCNLRMLIRAAHGVPLVFVLVPDKRTVYTPWIDSPLPAKESDLRAVLSDALGNGALDLTPVLQSAVRQGTQDVYSPNDSHWGIPGQRLAAEALIGRLSRDAFGKKDVVLDVPRASMLP